VTAPEKDLPSPLVAGDWLPTLGILLAVSGGLLALTGVTETWPALVPAGNAAEAADHPDGASINAGHGVAWTIADPRSSIMALDRPHTDHRVSPGIVRTRIGVDLAAPVRLRSDPHHEDPRAVLLQLAAAHHGRGGTCSGSCLMRRLTIQDPGQVDSDDRIANALFAPALMESSAAPIGDEHEPGPPGPIDNPVKGPR
jgi:hypothetical protein